MPSEEFMLCKPLSFGYENAPKRAMPYWPGFMVKMRCIGRDDGQRCENYTVYTLPYCDHHLEKIKGVKRLKSPGKGYGLFAARDISEGSIIGEYIGEVLSGGELQDRYFPYPVSTYVKERRLANGEVETEESVEYTMPYALEYRECKKGFKEIIDCLLVRGYLANMNHSPINNCKFEEYGRKGSIIARATRKIKKGREILVNYGIGYSFENIIPIIDNPDKGEFKKEYFNLGVLPHRINMDMEGNSLILGFDFSLGKKKYDYWKEKKKLIYHVEEEEEEEEGGEEGFIPERERGRSLILNRLRLERKE